MKRLERLETAGLKLPPKKVPRYQKPASINRELELLRTILLYAYRQGWILRKPFLAGPPLIVKSGEVLRDRMPTPEDTRRV